MDQVIAFGIRLLEGMFVIGWVGSVVVMLLAGLEDIETIFSRGSDITH